MKDNTKRDYTKAEYMKLLVPESCRNLGCAIAFQAAKNYCETKNEATKRAILRALRSDYMDVITDSASIYLAEKLEKEPEVIKERVQIALKEEKKIYANLRRKNL